ncbi:collagen alpha-1(XV) chain-like isoform X2 [Clytia hemisphaerica]|uniref:Laminin G domain-containing protein n=1 Tax=Clytia hemisphaerica TaxID=252671 RepID=A0A7M5VFQ7_9CNID
MNRLTGLEFSVVLSLISTLVTCQNIPNLIGPPPPSFEQINQTNLDTLWDKYFQNWLHDANEDINLLAAVGSPFPPDVRAVTGPFGRFGRPAVEFTPNSYVGRWARDLLPIPFFWNFGIKISLFLQSIYGGVLFSVLEYDHSKSILALNVLQASNNKHKIEFIYRSKSGTEEERNLVASFLVPRMDRRWNVFSITVVDQEVTLYFSGCDRVLRKVFKHERKALDVRSNSPIFLGNAGWYIKKPALYGAIYDLTMFKDYRDAIPKCHVDSRKTEVAKEERGQFNTTTTSLPTTTTTTTTTPTTTTTTPTTTMTTPTTTTTIPTTTTTTTPTTTTTTPTTTTTTPTTTTTTPTTATTTTSTTTTTTPTTTTTTPTTTTTTPTTTTTTNPTTTTTTPTTTTTTPTTTTTTPTTTTTTNPTTTTTTPSTTTTTPTTTTPTTTTTTTPTTTTITQTTTTTTPTTTTIMLTTSTTQPTTETFVTTEYTTRDTIESTKRRTSTFEMPTPTPYTADPDFSKVLTLYPKSTDEPFISSTPATVKDLRNEIKKELERIKSALNELGDKTNDLPSPKPSAPTSVEEQMAAKEIFKLEQARLELLDEIKEIDNTLIMLKVKNNLTTTRSSVNTTDVNQGNGTETGTNDRRFGDSLDEIVDRVIEKMEAKKEECNCTKEKESTNQDFELIAQKIINEKMTRFERDTEKMLNEIKLKRGEKGDLGIPGVRGKQGFDGVKGAKGEMGVGLKGEKGKGINLSDVVNEVVRDTEEKLHTLKGETGNKGSRGKIGLPGPRGPKGETGVVPEKLINSKFLQFEEDAMEFVGTLKGAKGEQGIMGLKGEEGKQGPQGEQGIQGIQGEKGERGARGEKGEQGIGEVGPKGEKGDSLKISEVAQEVIGLAERQIRKLKGDQGPPGDQGPRGLPGV